MGDGEREGPGASVSRWRDRSDSSGPDAAAKVASTRRPWRGCRRRARVRVHRGSPEATGPAVDPRGASRRGRPSRGAQTASKSDASLSTRGARGSGPVARRAVVGRGRCAGIGERPHAGGRGGRDGRRRPSSSVAERRAGRPRRRGGSGGNAGRGRASSTRRDRRGAGLDEACASSDAQAHEARRVATATTSRRLGATTPGLHLFRGTATMQHLAEITEGVVVNTTR